ncbi:Macrolide export ATP-binding/permease protein MacB [bacterium HR15]|nr:Macrolide export ATP-binding/permease protein MacB [bacterium HR15]
MVSGVLWRKVLREFWQSRWQYAAIATMVMLGVMLFAVANTLYHNLRLSYMTSYAEYHLEDFGIRVRAAPASVVQRVRQLPGVSGAEGRLVETAALELGREHPRRLMGRLIGIETRDPLQVNQLRVMAGRFLRGSRDYEVLLESKFAAYHRLRPHDRLTVLWRGEKVRFTIAGLVRSPEYIYVVQSKQQVMPSEDVFGVMFVPREVAGDLTGQSGLINEVRVEVKPGFNPALVAREVKQLLTPYGAEEPVMRADQPSYRLLETATRILRTYSVFFPLLFLSVSILTLYTLLMRLVLQQRQIIGLLRALGYTRLQVLWHYLSGALLVGIIGGTMGVGIALWLSGWLSRGYMSFLGLPSERVEPPVAQALMGLVMALGAMLVGGWIPAWQASRIPPAQALRPPPPLWGRVLTLDRWLPLLRRARLMYRLPLRNLTRSPRRTLVGIFGMAMGVMLVMLARGILDSRETAIARYLNQSLREDVRISFIHFQDAHLVAQVRNWRGVQRAEGVLELPIKLRRSNREYDALLMGVEPGSPMLQLRTEAGAPVSLTPNGVVCGQIVQQKLGLEPGDMVRLVLPADLSDEDTREHPVRVTGLVWETIGTVVYMPRAKVRALLHRELDMPPNPITSIRLWVQPAYRDELVQRLKSLPNAGVVVMRQEVVARVEALNEIARRFLTFMMAFGMVLALSVIFSVVTVSVLERRHEVATFLTIGFGQRQVFGLILAENALLTTLGMLLGLLLGRIMVSVFIAVVASPEQMELIAFRPYVYPRTYLLAGLGGWLVGLLAQLPALRTLARIDLVASLKERAL